MYQTTDTFTGGKVHIKDTRQMDSEGEKDLNANFSSLFFEESNEYHFFFIVE